MTLNLPGSARRLGVVLEQRFMTTPDGAFWTDGPYEYAHWTSYRKVFSEIVIVGRASPVQSAPSSAARVDGAGVEAVPVPCYVGPRQFVREFRRVRRAVLGAISQVDAVVLRVPGTLANVAFPTIVRSRIPFAVEVVGDPAEVFGSAKVGGLLRRSYRHWFVKEEKRQCALADVAIYVTENVLQRSYPPGPATFAIHCSDIELPDDAFVNGAKNLGAHQPFELVTVASLEQSYKGVDVLIRALARLRDQHTTAFRLSIVGDGRLRPDLESLASDLALANHVRFLGSMPGAVAVRSVLAKSDLFVLASRTEGLPRAMLEAMAQALPCIGTSVGGIRELIPDEDRVPPGDAAAMAMLIAAVLRDSLRRIEMANRNLRCAQQYRQSILRPKRQEAYSVLADIATTWHLNQP